MRLTLLIATLAGGLAALPAPASQVSDGTIPGSAASTAEPLPGFAELLADPLRDGRLRFTPPTRLADADPARQG